jgi:hypothetical protein
MLATARQLCRVPLLWHVHNQQLACWEGHPVWVELSVASLPDPELSSVHVVRPALQLGLKLGGEWLCASCNDGGRCRTLRHVPVRLLPTSHLLTYAGQHLTGPSLTSTTTRQGTTPTKDVTSTKATSPCEVTSTTKASTSSQIPTPSKVPSTTQVSTTIQVTPGPHTV